MKPLRTYFSGKMVELAYGRTHDGIQNKVLHYNMQDECIYIYIYMKIAEKIKS